MDNRDSVLNQKIKQILGNLKLTPSVFADKIGVQRSSISHILSGRNKPSFEIIQKIVKTFPDLGYEWLMDDSNKVSMPKLSDKSDNLITDYRGSSSVNYEHDNVLGKNLSNFMVYPTNEKQVSRVLVFYTDNSFSEYNPAAMANA
jgi:DNA-binding XRE family transcriptional regulator